MQSIDCTSQLFYEVSMTIVRQWKQIFSSNDAYCMQCYQATELGKILDDMIGLAKNNVDKLDKNKENKHD